jgi:hypothetical protein
MASMIAGTQVEVRDGFTRAWGRGFEVVAMALDGYQLCRLSDRAVLPVHFAQEHVRPADIGPRH